MAPVSYYLKVNASVACIRYLCSLFPKNSILRWSPSTEPQARGCSLGGATLFSISRVHHAISRTVIPQGSFPGVYHPFYLGFLKRTVLNHRMVRVGRDLCGSSSPTLLPKQGHPQHRAGSSCTCGAGTQRWVMEERGFHTILSFPCSASSRAGGEPSGCVYLTYLDSGLLGSPSLRKWPRSRLQALLYGDGDGKGAGEW